MLAGYKMTARNSAREVGCGGGTAAGVHDVDGPRDGEGLLPFVSNPFPNSERHR